MLTLIRIVTDPATSRELEREFKSKANPPFPQPGNVQLTRSILNHSSPDPQMLERMADLLLVWDNVSKAADLIEIGAFAALLVAWLKKERKHPVKLNIGHHTVEVDRDAIVAALADLERTESFMAEQARVHQYGNRKPPPLKITDLPEND